MDLIAPSGPVYQAGTLSGNPLAVACGKKTLDILSDPGLYESLDTKTKALTTGIKAAGNKHGIEVRVDAEGGMFGFKLDRSKDFFKKFFWQCLQRGIYFAPSPYEAGFLSTKHTEKQSHTIFFFT